MKNPIFGLILAGAVSAAAFAAAPAAAQDDVPSLKGKTIGVTSIGNEHYWNIKAFQGAIDEIKRLGGTPIGLDAGYVDSKQIAQIQTLIAQKPDAIIEELGTAAALEPSFKKITDAGIPLFTLDTGTSYAVNVTTSDNWRIGEELALKLVSDIGGEGNIVVFNGFYSVTPSPSATISLQNVLKYYPKVKIINPELKEVIPNTVQDAQTQITETPQQIPEGGDQGDLVGLGRAAGRRDAGARGGRPHGDQDLRRRRQPRHRDPGQGSEPAGRRRRRAAAVSDRQDVGRQRRPLSRRRSQHARRRPSSPRSLSPRRTRPKRRSRSGRQNELT